MSMARSTVLLPLLVGCVPDGAPQLEAQSGGRGYWPANSRTAILGGMEAGFEAVALDVGMTADAVPVLAMGPTTAGCTDPDGVPVDLTLHEHPWAALKDLQCGGLPDPAFPNAARVAEPLVTLDELLRLLKDSDARMTVRLHLAPSPVQAVDLATAVCDRWFAADRPNPWSVSSPAPERIDAFERVARAQSRDIDTAWVLSDGSELRRTAGLEDLRSRIDDVGADGVYVDWAGVAFEEVDAARAAGYRVGLWTVDDPDRLAELSTWPVDVIATHYPGDGS